MTEGARARRAGLRVIEGGRGTKRHVPKLDLVALRDGDYPHVTRAYAANVAECASVMLHLAGHATTAAANVKGTPKFRSATVVREEVGDLALRTRHDLQVTGEFGGYAIAFLLVRAFDNQVVFSQARKSGGFDWWLMDPNSDDVGVTARLEVSAIARGSEAKVKYQGKKKAKQTKRSASTNTPAYVVIVEYSAPLFRLTVRR